MILRVLKAYDYLTLRLTPTWFIAALCVHSFQNFSSQFGSEADASKVVVAFALLGLYGLARQIGDRGE